MFAEFILLLSEIMSNIIFVFTILLNFLQSGVKTFLINMQFTVRFTDLPHWGSEINL